MLIYARFASQGIRVVIRSRLLTAATVSRFTILSVLAAAALTMPLRAEPDGTRALRHVIDLAQEIGPRAVGSEADRRAAEYVSNAMQAHGLEVTLHEVTRIEDDEGEYLVDCLNVIGRLEGDDPETIVVGAHHDSRSGAVPGANDDASGIAVMLEAARLTAARPRRTGYLFISFCGEEDGLFGSRAFVAQNDLSRIRAMIALELLGRGEILAGPTPAPPEYWAQQAVLDAARRSDVSEVAARPIWTLVPRLVHLNYSADHEPFLRAGVPSLLLLGTYPAWTYHTTEDRVSSVTPVALERAARVLNRLLLDLEEAPPSRLNDPHYLPVTLLGHGLVIPTTGLQGVAILALLGSAVLIVTRARALLAPRKIFETARVLIVGATATGLGLSGLFASEALMEVIHGVRFPWSAHHGLHVAQALAGTLVTGWMGLNLFRRIKPTIEPGPYFAGALSIPIAVVITALARGWPEFAAPAAFAILAFLSSLMVQSTGRKLALGLLGLSPLVLMMTLDDYRTVVDLGGIQIPDRMLFTALGAVILPFVLFLAHVASFRDCLHSPVWWRLSGPWVGGPALAAWVVLSVAAALLPAYDGEHRRIVRTNTVVDLRARTATTTLSSLDVLNGVRLGEHILGREARRSRRATVDVVYAEDRFEFIARSETELLDEELAIRSTLRFSAPVGAHSIGYRFSSDSGFRVPGRGPALRHIYSFTEMTPPPESERTILLHLAPGGDLEVEMVATFREDLLDLDPIGNGRVFVHQARVIDSRRLVEGAPGEPAGEDRPALD